MINNHTIGADIEAFLQDIETGEIVSAEGIVQGSKNEPFVFDETNKFFATSLDNVLAEHCIPPSNNEEEFLSAILKCQDYLNHMDERLCTAWLPSARLDEKYLQTDNAKLFGCEPDYNCWLDGMPNSRPSSAVSNLRTAGFHVHVGYDEPSVEDNINFMKYFDMYVTLPSLLLEPANERRELYGKAGSFRHKPYGMEARTLSSYFASSPELISWVYKATQDAIQHYNNQTPLHPEVEQLINSVDIENIQMVVDINNINATIAA